jgi:uncharacterized membrane protein YcfT
MEVVRDGVKPAKARVDWVDHAKGICIFFVVMLHVNDFVQERTGAIGWLENVVTFARPFRMPDFFLIAGLFLAAAMRKPWRVYLDRKVVHFFYFYALWMTLEFCVLDLKHLIHSGAPTVASHYFIRFIDPAGPLWFIHILPIFFVVTRLTRSVSPWLIWLAAAGLHSVRIETGWHVPDEFASRFVYFYSGYILAPHVFRVASWMFDRVPAALGYLAGWAVVNGLVVAAGWSTLPGVSLALGYLGALAVITSATMFSKLEVTSALRYLGQNSIVVYLGDVGCSIIVVRLLEHVIPDVGTLALVSTVCTVALTIGVWRLALRTPIRFMYVRPPWAKVERPQPRRQPTPLGTPAVDVEAA